MKHNVVSTDHILYEVDDVFKPIGKEWLQSAVSSIRRAVQGIGTYASLEPVAKECQIIKSRVPLPCDAQAISAVEINGTRIPVSVGVVTYGHRQHVRGGYYITGGHIECPVAHGCVTIHYKQYPKDKKGFPLIIDDYDYKEAVKWKIMADMLAGGYKHPVFDWKSCNAMWEEHRGCAANAIKMPNREQMETLGRMWTSVYNDHLYYDNFGKGEEQRENSSEGGLNLPDYLDRNRLANNNE